MSEFKLLEYMQPDYQSKNSFYELFAFFINCNFDIDATFKKSDKNWIDNYAFVFHEYTHYLQTFFTVYGTSVLLDFFCFQHDILKKIREKILSNENYSPKFYHDTFNKEYINIKSKYVYDFSNKVKTNKKGLFKQKVYNDLLNKETKEYFIGLENGIIQHISPQCLRENMAMMTKFIIKTMSNEQVIKYFSNNNTKSIYSALFLYFSKKYPKIHDLPDFLYYFSEIALQNENPNKNLKRLFIYIKIHYWHYSNAKDFFKKLQNNKHFLKNIKEMKEKINSKIKEYEALDKTGNNYFNYLKAYLLKCVKGLDYLFNNKTIFTKDMSQSTLLYYVQKVSSPIIIQNINQQKDMYCFDRNNDAHTTLANFFALTLCFENYIIEGKEFKRCPFFSNIKYNPLTHTNKDACIFNMDNADVVLCSTDPYSFTSSKIGDCPFYNANKILGYQDQSELNKFL